MSEFFNSNKDSNVNNLLREILLNVQVILEDYFVGMYLHGSLAIGDFDPNRSDIDYLVVTTDIIPNDKILELETLHENILKSNLKWNKNFEGSYIPKNALRYYKPEDSIHPVIRADGCFGMDNHGYEWVIQRYVIREQGIILTGPEPKTLINFISVNELKMAVKILLKEWWVPQLQDSYRLSCSEYQAYATFTMCRALYTLAFGTVVSKQVAAKWGKEMFPEWSDLIQEAMDWHHGVKLNNIQRVLEFIRYTLDKVK